MNLGTSPTGAGGSTQRDAFQELETAKSDQQTVLQQQGIRINTLEAQVSSLQAPQVAANAIANYNSLTTARSDTTALESFSVNTSGVLRTYAYVGAGLAGEDDGLNTIVRSDLRKYVRRRETPTTQTLAEAQAVSQTLDPTLRYQGETFYYDANFPRSSIDTLGGQGAVAISPAASNTGNGAYLKDKYFNVKNYGAVADIVQAGGVRTTRTAQQNSRAIDRLIDDIYGYHGGGKIIVPAIGRIDLDYALMLRYSNFTIEGYGEGSYLYNANATAAFWVADAMILGNFGEQNYARLYNYQNTSSTPGQAGNKGWWRNANNITAGDNKISFASAASITALGIADGHMLLLCSNEWEAPALAAAAAYATANPGNPGVLPMIVNPDYTPAWSSFNEVVAISGTDVFLKYPLPYPITAPLVSNMSTQGVVITGSFGSSGKNWPLICLKNVHVRNLKLGSNPANGNGNGMQPSAIMGCTFENITLEGRSFLYGNLMTHSIFRNIRGTYYDAWGDLKVGPSHMLFEDCYGKFAPNPLFTQPLNVSFSPDTRAHETVFNRCTVDARQHPGSMRLNGRDISYYDCNFYTGAAVTFDGPTQMTDGMFISFSGTGLTPTENIVIKGGEWRVPATAVRTLFASAGTNPAKNITIDVEKVSGQPSSQLFNFSAGVTGMDVRIPFYPNFVGVSTEQSNKVIEVNKIYDSMLSREDLGNVSSTTANNVAKTWSHPIDSLRKKGRILYQVEGTFTNAGTVALVIDGAIACTLNGTAGQAFSIEMSLFARTATTNARWNCVARLGNTQNTTRGSLTKNIQTQTFDVVLQAWTAGSGNIAIDLAERTTFPAQF